MSSILMDNWNEILLVAGTPSHDNDNERSSAFST
ncbi:hypothetical protein M7I_5704 [Glarea lozoyensis 74030]|uniref:Uncharacterized protein n=1 Tax=Glarea lozoyensis (strain ATCC 74030 / MF5533) TaxID=1104152 RepID=H0ESL1_GLAL7|nr:hypothetical protein M7I_5704 [Glarea lozoyensis 74030]